MTAALLLASATDGQLFASTLVLGGIGGWIACSPFVGVLVGKWLGRSR